MHGSTENGRGQGQTIEAPQPEPFQLGTDDQGNLIMGISVMS